MEREKAGGIIVTRWRVVIENLAAYRESGAR